MGVAMLLVLGSLFMGVFYMGREGDAAKLKSQKMMRMRVYMQGVALLLFILAALSAK
jgi:hypothetical protein